MLIKVTILEISSLHSLAAPVAREIQYAAAHVVESESLLLWSIAFHPLG